MLALAVAGNAELEEFERVALEGYRPYHAVDIVVIDIGGAALERPEFPFDGFPAVGGFEAAGQRAGYRPALPLPETMISSWEK